jgi:hypothetical protein
VGGFLESVGVGLLPVALAAEFDDVGVMDQPVDGGLVANTVEGQRQSGLSFLHETIPHGHHFL